MYFDCEWLCFGFFVMVVFLGFMLVVFVFFGISVIDGGWSDFNLKYLIGKVFKNVELVIILLSCFNDFLFFVRFCLYVLIFLFVFVVSLKL